MLQQDIAVVNLSSCSLIATMLNSIDIPKPQEDVPELGLSKEEEANFWFFLAAICHQTSPVGSAPLEGTVDGVYRKGWDFLLHVFSSEVQNKKSLLSPSNWSQFTASSITKLFGETISNPRVRAELVVDLGVQLNRMGQSSIFFANEQCNGLIASGPNCLLDFLPHFSAYSDPVQKKSVFFLALMANSGLWRYRDEILLPAPVDYHEVRGHLRLGTVKIGDRDLENRIQNGLLVSQEEDIHLRLAVQQAIHEIAKLVGVSPNQLHYFFWNLFRVYCPRDKPLCEGQAVAKLPVKYLSTLKKSSCPFIGICPSARLSNAINEHRTETVFY